MITLRRTSLLLTFALFFPLTTRAESLPNVAREYDFVRDMCESEPEVSKAELAKTLDDTHFVILPGFLNEGFYYALMRLFGTVEDAYLEILESARAKTRPRIPPKKRIATHLPMSSSRTVEENAATACQYLGRIIGEHKNIVLLAHSLGGSALLEMTRTCPLLLKNPRVRAMVSLQGAIRGSRVADILYNDVVFERWMGFVGQRDKEQDRTLAWYLRRNMHMNLFLIRTLPTQTGLESARTMKARARDSRYAKLENSVVDFGDNYAVVNLGDLHAELTKKIFFVRSHEDSKDMPFSLWPLGRFLDRYGKNDGMIPFGTQKSETIGRVLMDISRANHLDIVATDPVSEKPDVCRKNFAYILLDRLNEVLSAEK